VEDKGQKTDAKIYTKSSFDQWSDEIWLTASYDF
jgi:hypothetical protein